MRYRPAAYHRERTFSSLRNKPRVVRIKVCSIITSFSIRGTHNLERKIILRLWRIYEYRVVYKYP